MKTPAAEHGTYSRYTSHGCRCELCRAANTEFHRLNRLRRRSPATLVHGQRSTYVNKNCRCGDCRAANAAWGASIRQRQLVSA